jgi:hypothetical protein
MNSRAKRLTASALLLLALSHASATRGQAEAFPTDSFLKAEATVRELSGLTMAECVKVINLKTDYQINLETLGFDSQGRYRLDLIGLQREPIDQILTNLLGQTEEYLYLKTGKTINIVPRNQCADTNSVFNRLVAEYQVTTQNVVDAFLPLCQSAPQLIFRFLHISVDCNESEEWLEDNRRIARQWPSASISLRNVSLRTCLNTFADEFGDLYWISRPSAETTPQWYWVWMFRRDDGKQVLWDHDSTLREQMEKWLNDAVKEYERSRQESGRPDKTAPP